MALTPLHTALGRRDPELTLDLVERACDERLPENEQLDYKRDLPLTSSDPRGSEDQALELAKDIAAMANGRGGMIIYGVREDGAPNPAAAVVTPVHDVDETTYRRIRQVAANFIYPPVLDIDFHLLPVESGGAVLVMLVPASNDAPHLVRPRRGRSDQTWFMAPYRHGPDTSTMVEKQLETFYERRWALRRQRNQELRDLHEDLSRDVGPGDMPWVVAVARPLHPVLASRDDFTSSAASQIFESAWEMSSNGRLAMQPHRFLSGSTRPGLRRFRQAHTRTLPNGALPRTVAEVHFNGSVGVAWRRGGAFGLAHADKSCLSNTDLDNVCLDLFALIRSAARVLGVDGDYDVRLAVSPDRVPFRRMDPYTGEHYEYDPDVFGSPRFVPLEATLRTNDSEQLATLDMVELARDAMNQIGGSTSLEWLIESS
ncbi:AlbA family DNA-binding domain-containing protein [Nocardioides aurantiacus]|uniref:AlbA family DNA-binding domain-containing protein n=1 Tax=Nocardioides aurantiacus TaxID=86796 RepID=UPI00403F2FB0